MQLKLWFLYFMLIFGCLGWLEVVSEEPDEKKAFFEVHDENKGNINIHASKDEAEVNSKGDSLQLVIHSGSVKVPVAAAKHHIDKGKDVEESSKNTIHLAINPVDIGGLKREGIFSKKRKLAYSQGRRTFENSIMLENWKEKNKHHISRNLKRAHKVRGRSTLAGAKVIKRKAVNIKLLHHVRSISRRSDVDRTIRLQGQSGALHVRTGKNETRLTSENGNLDIFMENPDKENIKHKANSNAESPRRSPVKRIRVGVGGPIHIINPIEGAIKRSYGAGKGAKRSKSRGVACNVPPCSTR